MQKKRIKLIRKRYARLRLERKETSRDFWLSDRKINCIKTVALLKYNISVINIKPISPFNWLKLQELIGLLLPLTISITDLAATRFYSHKIWQNYSHKKMKKIKFSWLIYKKMSGSKIREWLWFRSCKVKGYTAIQNNIYNALAKNLVICLGIILKFIFLS